LQSDPQFLAESVKAVNSYKGFCEVTPKHFGKTRN